MFANSTETKVMWSTVKITSVVMVVLIQTFDVVQVQILQLSSGSGDSKDEFIGTLRMHRKRYCVRGIVALLSVMHHNSTQNLQSIGNQGNRAFKNNCRMLTRNL